MKRVFVKNVTLSTEYINLMETKALLSSVKPADFLLSSSWQICSSKDKSLLCPEQTSENNCWIHKITVALYLSFIFSPKQE